MQRITRRLGDHYAAAAGSVQPQREGATGEAIDRLGRYEDLHEALLAQQDKIERDLEALRAEGKQDTLRFRSMLAQKLAGANTLALFAVRDL